MLNKLVSDWVRWWGKEPCFRIHGKCRREVQWREIDVYASHQRDLDGRFPLWRGTCITWSSEVIAVGWDFAAGVFREQAREPASRQHAVEVAGGRLHHLKERCAAGAPSVPTHSEILAHECGHTGQALRLGAAYLPLVGAVTLFREGPHPWNHFENDASEQGLFGGVVNGTVCRKLMDESGI